MLRATVERWGRGRGGLLGEGPLQGKLAAAIMARAQPALQDPSNDAETPLKGFLLKPDRSGAYYAAPVLAHLKAQAEHIVAAAVGAEAQAMDEVTGPAS